MTSVDRFDYDDFVARFRAACAAYGIDPARGASGYQVVHVRAARQRAAAEAANRADRWWEQSDLWLSCPPYRSETEAEAIWNVFSEAYGLMAQAVARAARLRRAQLALRELHDRRGRQVGGR